MFGSVGPMEMILWLLIALVVGAPVVIAILVNKRHKRSGGSAPTNAPPAGAFSSPEVTGMWTKRLLVASLIVAGVAVVSGLLQLELLSRMTEGAGYTMEAAARNDARQGTIGVLQILLLIGTAITFLIWFHRANKNLPSLGQTGLFFTPGWAVGFFFVPFLNLVRPFQAMRAVWHGSDPGRLGFDFAPHKANFGSRLGTPSLVGWWWGLFLVFNFIGNAAGRLLTTSQQTMSGFKTGTVLSVISDLLVIPAALVAIRLVGRLTRWQVEKERLISQGGAQSGPFPSVSPQ